MLHEFRFAFRQLLKSPSFTLIAVLTLALGIGANTAIFTLLNTLLFKPLPYPDSDRIVQVNLDTNLGPNSFGPTSGGIYLDFQQNASQFEHLTVAKITSLNLTGIEEPIRVSGMEVSASYLQTFGLDVAYGRDFSRENETSGDTRVVLISDTFWKTQFGEDPTIINEIITLDYQSYTVIGILKPNTFVFPDINFLVPAAIEVNEWKQNRNYDYVCTIIGKLKEEAILGTAQSELETIKASLNDQYPDMMKRWIPVVRSLQESYFGDARPYAISLMVAVGMVLLVACANIANLLLARATSRRGEMAVRTAIGASGWRIVRQCLSESLALALIGAAVGLVVGIVALKPLAALVGFADLPAMDLEIDLTVLLYTLGISLATGLLFGAFPAFKALRSGTASGLREATRSATSAKGNKIQSALIVTEIALTVILLVSIGLLLKSFTLAALNDPGFAKENILTFEIDRSSVRSPTPEDRTRFTQEVLEKLKHIPGVSDAAMVSTTPMNGNNFYGAPFWRDDQPDTADTYFPGFDAVNGNYWDVLEIPLLKGRLFDIHDQKPDSRMVVIINQQVVDDVYGEDEPLGSLIHHDNQLWTVVGVVGNTFRASLDTGIVPMVYKPQIHWPWATSYVVKTSLPPLALAQQAKQAVLDVDPQQPIDRVRTLEQAVSSSLQGRYVMIWLVTIFGIVSFLLAAIGIYGLLSYFVEQRSREFGIRLAIGARPQEIVSLVFKHGMILTSLGLVIGVLCVIALGRYLAFALYQVQPYDPIVILLVALLTIGISAFACWRPARFASKTVPSQALRLE